MPVTRRVFLGAAAAAGLTACSSSGEEAAAHSTDGSTSSDSSPAASSSHVPSSIAAPSAPSALSAPSSGGVVSRSVEVRHGPRTSTKVALTFHGAGDVALAEALLRRLEKRRVQATVMAVGTWLQAQPRMARRIVNGGHDLGNHTLHHYPMRGLSALRADAEVEGGARVLRRTSGSRGAFFRASGTQVTTPTIRHAAALAGYDHCISYDVDGLDWQDPSTTTVVRAVLDGSRGGSIISLHLGHPVTVAALPAILDGLDEAGLSPVTLSELLA